MTGIIIGKLPDTVHKSEKYFQERFCFVDCRGTLEIDSTAEFGYGVRILTAGHNISLPKFGGSRLSAVIIGPNVWVASFSLLYGCKINQGCVISAGSVTTGVIVPENSMVQGNPARVVAIRKPNGGWIRLVDPQICLPWTDRKR